MSIDPKIPPAIPGAAMRPEVVETAPPAMPTLADVAVARALAAAAEAFAATRSGPNAQTVATVAAGRAAAEHLARAFNDNALVNLLAALAVDAAHYGGGRRFPADGDDIPF